MALFIISYDLNKTKNYQKLWKELERLDCHRAIESLWLASLNNTSMEILEHFKDFIDDDDSLIVAKTTKADLKRFRANAGTKEWLSRN